MIALLNMEENLTQSQIPVNPVPVPPVQPPPPKRFSLKWILVAVFTIVVIFISIFFVLISRQPSKVVNTNESIKIGEYKVLAKDGWEELEYLDTREAKNTNDVYAVFSQLYPNYVDKKNEMYIKDIVVKGDNAEVYFGGDESWLTDRMGSTGPYNYSGLVTFALTEDPGIKKVDFKLQSAGTHFGPGIRNREDFIDLWPRKTYKDEKYKFQFSYPSTVYLKISSKFPDQIFLTKNDIDINEVNEGPFALVTVAIWDKNKFEKAGYPQQEKYLKSENIIVDGVNAVKISGIIPEDQYLAGTYHQEVSFPLNDKIIHFMFYEDPANNTKLLDQILSTFKFINMESDKNISDAKLQEMINNCEIIGDYIYHSGEKGIVLKNNETLELKNKSVEEIKQLIDVIPSKCGPERVKVIE